MAEVLCQAQLQMRCRGTSCSGEPGLHFWRWCCPQSRDVSENTAATPGNSGVRILLFAAPNELLSEPKLSSLCHLEIVSTVGHLSSPSIACSPKLLLLGWSQMGYLPSMIFQLKWSLEAAVEFDLPFLLLLSLPTSEVTTSITVLHIE